MLSLPEPIRERWRRQGAGITVLVVRLGAMGDVLRTLPAVRALRRTLPEAALLWAVDDRWSSLLRDDADLDGLVVAPRTAWKRLAREVRTWPALVRCVLAFRRSIRRARADLVLDFHGNLRSGLSGWLSGAPVRVGYAGHEQKEGNHWLTTHRVPSGDRRTPRMERNLSLVRALGVTASSCEAGPLPLARRGRSEAEEVLRATLGTTTRPPAVVSPGASASQAYKKPPVDLLAAACRRLAGHEVASLVVWGPGEEEDARALVARAGDGARLAPATSLEALGALLERAALFVGGDSGPLHMACACGCPVLGLYGPTDPRVNQPWAVPCRAVFPPDRRYTGIKRIDRRGGGFEGLTPGQVERAVDGLLGEVRGRRALGGEGAP